MHTQRALIVAIIAFLNAGWLISLGCAAFCLLQPCSKQGSDVAASEGRPGDQKPLQDVARPHQGHQMPMPEAEAHYVISSASCPNRDCPMTSVVAMTAPSIDREAQYGPSFTAFSCVNIITPVPFVRASNIASPSPPGVLTGRFLLEKESVLRI